MRAIDLTGQRFGRLVVTQAAGRKDNQSLWVCRCDCGAVVTVYSGHLRSGRSQSCGCLRREISVARETRHGHSTHGSTSRTYNSWCNLIQRCTNPKHHHFKYYGARGITVCERWRESFDAFLADMGERPDGMSIDRIDNDKGYCKDNCKWSTQSEQTRNQRRGKRNERRDASTNKTGAQAADKLDGSSD